MDYIAVSVCLFHNPEFCIQSIMHRLAMLTNVFHDLPKFFQMNTNDSITCYNLSCVKLSVKTCFGLVFESTFFYFV
jgi:hypothetical protein